MEALDKAGAPAIKYGQFINDTISFIILGFVMFLMVKAYSKLKKEEPAKEPKTPAYEVLLAEIRDALKK